MISQNCLIAYSGVAEKKYFSSDYQDRVFLTACAGAGNINCKHSKEGVFLR